MFCNTFLCVSYIFPSTITKLSNSNLQPLPPSARQNPPPVPLYSLFIPYIHIYILLNTFHIFPLCFLDLWSQKQVRTWPKSDQSFGATSLISGPKLSFWNNFQMILHGFAWRSSKKCFETKTLNIKNQKIQQTFNK